MHLWIRRFNLTLPCTHRNLQTAIKCGKSVRRAFLLTVSSLQYTIMMRFRYKSQFKRKSWKLYTKWSDDQDLFVFIIWSTCSYGHHPSRTRTRNCMETSETFVVLKNMSYDEFLKRVYWYIIYTKRHHSYCKCCVYTYPV